MKKRKFSKKLRLSKETIARLTVDEMNASIGGAKETKIGISCYTDRCCQTNDCD